MGISIKKGECRNLKPHVKKIPVTDCPMAYVPVPKDLNNVKTKVVLNLTKRQLICFGAAATTGLPAYIATRGILGDTNALMLMIVLMSPMFLLAMYEKDGQPAERILRNYIRAHIFFPGIRPYKTVNLYSLLEKPEKEGDKLAAMDEGGTNRTKKAGKHYKPKDTKKKRQAT